MFKIDFLLVIQLLLRFRRSLNDSIETFEGSCISSAKGRQQFDAGRFAYSGTSKGTSSTRYSVGCRSGMRNPHGSSYSNDRRRWRHRYVRGAYAGQEIIVNGEKLMMLREEDILAILVEQTAQMFVRDSLVLEPYTNDIHKILPAQEVD